MRQLSSAVTSWLERGFGAVKTIQPQTLWVQSSFTVLTIIAFGTFTLALHNEFLQGNRVALGLSLFIGLFWTFRVGVDAFYFSHKDWPQGKLFAVGHFLLTSLFVSFMVSYLGLFCWHVWLKA